MFVSLQVHRGMGAFKRLSQQDLISLDDQSQPDSAPSVTQAQETKLQSLTTLVPTNLRPPQSNIVALPAGQASQQIGIQGPPHNPTAAHDAGAKLLSLLQRSPSQGSKALPQGDSSSHSAASRYHSQSALQSPSTHYQGCRHDCCRVRPANRRPS